jgi:hypothetical protein
MNNPGMQPLLPRLTDEIDDMLRLREFGWFVQGHTRRREELMFRLLS